MHSFRTWISFVALLVGPVAVGQLFYPDQTVWIRESAQVVTWLNQDLPLPSGWSYRLEHLETTPHATYRLYGVYRDDIPAMGLQTNVCVRKDGKLVSAAFPWRNRAEQLPRYAQDQPVALNFSTSSREPRRTEAQPVYFFQEAAARWVPAWQIRDRQTEPEHRWWERFYAVETGDLLFERDLLVRWHVEHARSGSDTAVSGKVFLPDPLTKAGVLYGGIYTDQNDANTSVLDPLRVTQTFRANWNGSVFQLASPEVVIQEFDPPVIAPATSTVAQFNFSRTDPGFEDVNAFYHIQTLKKHTLSLGFNAVPYAIPVDPHAINGQDNSFFDWSTTPPRLYFGEGGVDDAEDADVVVHEYGHAISQSIAPNTNFGDERSSLDEAFGDYWAVSYSRFLSSYGWQRVFGWDGHNEFWSGRSAQNGTQKMYPGLTFANIYAHTNVFVDALMRSWPHLGRNEMDALVLESAHQWTSGMTFRTAAELILQADTLRNNGVNAWRLHRDFATWQILLPKADLNESSVHAAPVWIVEEGIATQVAIQLECWDAWGRSLGRISLQPGVHALDRWWNLPSGTYLLEWSTATDRGRLRWAGIRP